MLQSQCMDVPQHQVQSLQIIQILKPVGKEVGKLGWSRRERNVSESADIPNNRHEKIQREKQHQWLGEAMILTL